MNNFIKENSKWIVRVLVIVGLVLIIKLWLIGLQIRGTGSGGYIDLSIGWRFDYYRISAGYIAVTLFIISLFLIKVIKNTKNKIKKIQIAFLILLLGLTGKTMFFLVSPDFKFYLTPVTSQYKDKDGNITDIDKYLESIGKYCLEYPYNSLNYMDTKNGMCSKNDKFQTFFKNVDEYIKVLEYAKNINHKRLYDRTYGGVNQFGVEKVLEKYDDKTFQAYVIKREWNNGDLMKEIVNNTGNTLIINLIQFINNEIIESEEIKNDNLIDKFWRKLDVKIRNELRNIPGVSNVIITKIYIN